ncbi:DUF86 domain-containing protein [Mesobacillus foraminis]|uniref:type VII toxin-antitoxin system HepT family RNase toxin n=1 Tax=Mesobacillus foraminis TaxID=279826 RepID=UPI001BE9CEC8|nr:HepT-like ribonuclease domain-containing protein [Mesobacillus foraminis]MBT2756853.1 DUF86 domain-containing protein [Mesobacillus foraminis]
MENELILKRVSIIEHCIRRIHEEYNNNPHNLENIAKRDSIILNLQRACEACIALAMHIVAEKKLGQPRNSLEAFNLLEFEGVIPSSLSGKLKVLLCFQKVAVKDDKNINLESLLNVLDNHLVDFFHYTKTILNY